MITVEETQDLDYIKNVLSTPGMGKLCSGDGTKIDPEFVDEVVQHYETKFLVARDDGEPRGFVAFVRNESGAYFLHVALKTGGKKTLDALTKSLDYAANIWGISEVHGVYPDRESIEGLVDVFGFKRHGKVDSGKGFELNHISKELVTS